MEGTGYESTAGADSRATISDGISTDFIASLGRITFDGASVDEIASALEMTKGNPHPS